MTVFSALCRTKQLQRVEERINIYAQNIAKSKKEEYCISTILPILFTVISGMKTLDSMCLTYMSETIIEQLSITVGQYSKLSSYFYLSYSTSCILVGYITSRMSKRKNLIVAMTLSTGLSPGDVFCTSYMGFALCRLAVGLFQGGSMSVMLAIIAKNLVKEDYGKRYGVITLGSSIISLFIGPVFFTYMALHYRWNTAYRFTGIILIMLGIITLVTTREVNVEVFQKKASEGSP